MATGRRDAEALAAAATSMSAAAEIQAKPVESVAATVADEAPAVTRPPRPRRRQRPMRPRPPPTTRRSEGMPNDAPPTVLRALDRPDHLDRPRPPARCGPDHHLERHPGKAQPHAADRRLREPAPGRDRASRSSTSRGDTITFATLGRSREGRPGPDEHDAGVRAARADRARRRPRVQGRPVQHRRHRPGAGRRLHRRRSSGPRSRSSRSRSRSRSRSLAGALGGAAYGFIPGVPQGVHRRPRGRRDDHAELARGDRDRRPRERRLQDHRTDVRPDRRRRQCRAADPLRPRRQSRDPDRPRGRPDRLRS